MRLRLGCLIALAYPIIEIAAAVIVAQWIGWWWLFVYAIGCIVLGLGLVRYALGATGRSFSLAVAALQQRNGETQVLAIEGSSAPELAPPAQTLLIVPAGLLIAIPGIVTTILGLVLWLPPVRAIIAARIERSARRLGPPGSMPDGR
jgi:UPF0716 protein FxsA